MRFGLYSNCEKHGPTNCRTDFCYSTETQSLEPMSFRLYERSETSPPRTAFRSPWQNGVAERWVGSCRRDLLDHVIILNERHLKRLMSAYLLYYHEDRTHLGLGKDTPVGRVAAPVSPSGNKIISLPRLSGLHHRYAVAA